MISPERITIDLPDFAAMTDDEVISHSVTRVRDGRWSPLTRSLLRRFEVAKLDLNTHWAATWQRWKCPCCDREKAAIARVSSDGVLLCKLVSHHDHLGDFVKTLMPPLSRSEADNDQHVRRQLARSSVFALVERFTATLLCEDCNNADADMKALLAPSTDRWFSFSPDEIRGFIRVRDNKSHEVDEDAGLAAWRSAEHAFRDRLAFARTVAARVNAGLHDRESHGSDTGSSLTGQGILWRLASDRAGPRTRLYGMEDALWARSLSSDGHATTRRQSSARPIVAPSSAHFASVVAANQDSRFWTCAKDDWTCTICRRSKFEITRQGNTGKFGAKIQTLRRFSEETDPQSLAWRRQTHDISIVLASQRTYTVCQDCRAVVSEAAKVMPGTTQDDLRPADIAALIGSPVPHSRHQLDRAALITAISENAVWRSAVTDYWAHEREASEVRINVDVLSRQVPRDDAICLVLARYEERLDLPAGVGEGRFLWLLAEGDRLAALAKADQDELAGR